MNFLTGIYFLLSTIVFTCIGNALHGQDALSILEKTYRVVSEVHNLSYTVHLKERVEGVLSEERTGKVKMTNKPLRVYYFMISPRFGAELLYNSENYGDNIYINPNGFPWFTFNVSSDNKWMRKSRHHTILDAGYAYIKDILGRYLEKKSPDHDGLKVTNLGHVRIRENDCIKLSIEKEVFFFKNYTLKEGESITDYSRKEGLSDFMILERNRKYNWYDCAKPGETILVPNFYAKKIDFYIDSLTFLPVSLSIYDDLGLFEEVTFYNIDIKPAFPANAFSVDNPEYGF